MIPEYMDLPANLSLKKGQLPFYIGVSRIKPSTSLHHHDFVELSFVISGSGIESVNGKPHRLEPGVGSFLLPHHMHEIRSDPEQTVVKYCCMFDINILLGSIYDSEWEKLLYGIGTVFPSYARFEPKESQTLHRLFGELLEEYGTPPRPGRNTMIQLKLTEAMLLFVRAASASTGEPDAGDSRQPEASRAFWPMLQHVHIHYAEKLSLRGIARQFGVSAPYVSRMFKANTGRSFLSYLHELRIESAANLLVATGMPIAEVAAESGFDSFRTFSRVFHALKKQTPREFRHSRGVAANPSE